MRRLLPITLPLIALLVSCGTWRRAGTYDGWSLYELRDQAVSPDLFEAAFEPAFAAVEARLGPFQSEVAVHAWEGAVKLADDGLSRAPVAAEAGITQVPGIGPARIQAYHSRGGGAWNRSGIFIGAAEVGTAVHELVHARLAEVDRPVPLWFEEGLASLLGDGALVRAEGEGGEPRWVVDGLACWPLRELREEGLDDEALARLLDLEASDGLSVRDNVLVHFVGWAVVFDLYRKSGAVEWERWLDELEDSPLHVVRRHLKRTLAAGTELAWLERLNHPDPAIRLATAKGSWKLRSPAVLQRLLRRLEVERDPEVRVGLAVNSLAAAGELTLPWRRWRAIEETVEEVLRDARLADPREERAARNLSRGYRLGDERGEAQEALRELARFWEE